MNIFDNKIDDLSNTRKMIWEHHREFAWISGQYTELLIGEIAVFLGDLQAVLLESEMSKEKYAEYKKKLLEFYRQVKSFEKKVDYNLFSEDFNFTEINPNHVLSRGGQVRYSFEKLTEIVEEIGTLNPDLEEMLSFSFQNCRNISENINFATHLCKVDGWLFSKEDDDIDDIIRKGRIAHFNQYADKVEGIKTVSLLPKSIRRVIAELRAIPLDENYDRAKGKLLVADTQHKCKDFIDESTSLWFSHFLRFSDQFEQDFIDCDMSYENFAKYKEKEKCIKDYAEIIVADSAPQLTKQCIEILEEYYEEYEQMIMKIAEINPLLRFACKSRMLMQKSTIYRILNAFETISNIPREYKLQMAVVDFNKDLKLLLNNLPKVSDYTSKLALEYEDYENGYVEDAFWQSDDDEPNRLDYYDTKFEQKWGIDSISYEAPLGGTYLNEIDIPATVFANGWQEYFCHCGELHKYDGKGILREDIRDSIRKNEEIESRTLGKRLL